jgi:RNA polymerase sigma-70 factor, ECF subfamily
MAKPICAANPAEVFERNRTRLRGLAYRILGSVADTDDILQEVYIRWHQSDVSEVRSPEAWMTRVTTRLCVDRLRSASRERELYAGSWLPEPLCASDPTQPDCAWELGSNLSMALFVLLERLAPEERTVFLLRDIFDYGYVDIAAALGKTQAACRQLLHRARERVRSDRPRFQVNSEAHRRLVARFVEATRAADRNALTALFAKDATLTSDGGGKVRAAINVIRGGDRIARLLVGLARKTRGERAEKLMRINSELGVVTYLNGLPVAAFCFEVDAARIRSVYRVLNPEKLKNIPPPPKFDPPLVTENVASVVEEGALDQARFG